jgi:heme/copper-type cytochrome/quinol oxidase subunit 2
MALRLHLIQVVAVVLVVVVVVVLALTQAREILHQQAQAKAAMVVMVLTILDPATLVAVAAVPMLLPEQEEMQREQPAALAEQVQHLQLRERL